MNGGSIQYSRVAVISYHLDAASTVALLTHLQHHSVASSIFPLPFSIAPVDRLARRVERKPPSWVSLPCSAGSAQSTPRSSLVS
jgi:hypothetical protein